MLIGLTGGYCAGKNTVASILETRGWTCIDVDKLGHEAMEKARDAIVGRFGPGVVGPDGLLDRRELATIVFSDPVALADQEAIVHPLAIRLMNERIVRAEEVAAAAGHEALVCINAALLHRTGRIVSCDCVIEVRSPLLMRIARGAKRDGAGTGAAFRRIMRQKAFRSELRAQTREAGCPLIILHNWRGRAALARVLKRALRRVGLST
jgi:dephospho-CoA kinase